jgi:hypothetical protein
VGELWTGVADVGRFHLAQLPRATYVRAAIFCLGAIVAFVLASFVRKVLILLTLQSGNVNPPQGATQQARAGESQQARDEMPEQAQLYSNQMVRVDSIL